MIKAVVFDMDGVLLDARELHFTALNMALEPFGTTISHLEHESTFDGLPTKTKLEKLTQLGRVRVQDHGTINFQKQLQTKSLLREFIHPNNAHLALMEALREKKYKIGLASNSIKETVQIAMELTDLGKFMEFTLSTENVTNPKPNPEIYLLAIKKMGVAPNETLVIEDNEHGVEAARLSGAHILQVASVDEVNQENIFRKISEINES